MEEGTPAQAVPKLGDTPAHTAGPDLAISKDKVTHPIHQTDKVANQDVGKDRHHPAPSTQPDVLRRLDTMERELRQLQTNGNALLCGVCVCVCVCVLYF